METLTRPLKINRSGSVEELHISSPAFAAGESIPFRFSCEGKNINPPLLIHDLSGNTVSIAITMTDLDAPEKPWSHWVVWNIPPMNFIPEGFLFGIKGVNDFNRFGYTGTGCTKPNHQYCFRIFALDSIIDISRFSKQRDFRNAIKDHVVATGHLLGYSSQRSNYKYSLL